MAPSKKLKIKFFYISNFKPTLYSEYLVGKTFYFPKLRNKMGQVICRNYFLFMIFLKFFYNKETVFKNALFIKPIKNQVLTVLRAPYKNKLGRHQYGFSRYKIDCTFDFNIKQFRFNSHTELFYLLKFNKKFYQNFESNICYQHKVVISFFFQFLKFFTI